MGNILRKEMTLSASIVTYCFIGFGFMFFLPGYPVLCSAFFVTLGIFKSFQNAREANDFVFSALLPVAKSDVVKGKYLFSCLIEMAGFLAMLISTVVRMTILKDCLVYRENALMNANFFALAGALVIFGLFNLVFIGGFFKTAYKFGSFVVYIIVAFVVIFAFEAAHYVPGMDGVNAFGFDCFGFQCACLGVGAVIFLVFTTISYRYSCYSFDRIDL